MDIRLLCSTTPTEGEGDEKLNDGDEVVIQQHSKEHTKGRGTDGDGKSMEKGSKDSE